MPPSLLVVVVVFVAVAVLEYELLEPLAGVDFAQIERAVRIQGADVDPVELARVAATVAECRHDAAVRAIQYPHIVVLAIRYEEIRLLIIGRADRLPSRSIAACFGTDEKL